MRFIADDKRWITVASVIGATVFLWSALVFLSLRAEDHLAWTQLPSLPDPEGFAGSFAGVIDNRLVVAGGANFPNAKPWEGGQKIWHDSVFVLEEKATTWKVAGKLPLPLGYGVSITTPEGLICIGGSDAHRHYAEVFRLSLGEAGGVVTTPLPSLPHPCANLCGALLGRTIYIAGGMEHPHSGTALHQVWALHLDHLGAGWQTLEPWPGKERILATAGVAGGSFFIVGGAALQQDASGKPERIWLKDGYRFTPGKSWERIVDAPTVSVAAPSPMPMLDEKRLLLIGGDDGAQLRVDPLRHQGFPKSVFAYDVPTNQWHKVGEIPLGLVTTTAVQWGDLIVIPGGEKMPGTRSTEVWATKRQGAVRP